MTETTPWTVGRLLEWTTDFLRKQGSESPRLDAEVLLAHARGSSRIQLYTSFQEEPSEEVRSSYREMVRRRAEGTPVAYLVGHKEFFSIDFLVNPGCLIPRPETEHLVVAALDWVKDAKKTGAMPQDRWRIADVGTGSGCIAISIAKHLAMCEIAAVDLSAEALAVTRQNLAKHHVEDRIELFEGDLLGAIPESRGEWDLILSNPPYVSEAEFETLAKDVRQHEPRLALVGGVTGFEITRRLIEEAANRLRIGGGLLIESSPMLVPTIEQNLIASSAWSLRPTIKDLQGHARIIIAQRIR